MKFISKAIIYYIKAWIFDTGVICVSKMCTHCYFTVVLSRFVERIGDSLNMQEQKMIAEFIKTKN